LCLSACARPVGDFGRAEPDPLHDGTADALRGVNELSAPGSVFNLTDQEQEMRDRIWRYLVAPQAYDWFGDALVELRRIGLRSSGPKPLPSSAYFLWLHSTKFASSPVRYAKLGDDVRSDLDMMPSAFASICAVEAVDRQRGIAANGIAGLEASMRKGAAARQAENRSLAQWFATAVATRSKNYSYALDHLLVETPHVGAIAVDAELSDLQVYVDAADGDDFCTPNAGGRSRTGANAVGSRYLHPLTKGLGS
jgi:hypothetical protein